MIEGWLFCLSSCVDNNELVAAFYRFAIHKGVGRLLPNRSVGLVDDQRTVFGLKLESAIEIRAGNLRMPREPWGSNTNEQSCDYPPMRHVAPQKAVFDYRARTERLCAQCDRRNCSVLPAWSMWSEL